ncbi:hypothetical protein TNCV_1159171 [Trichonephila clavipes]|nr:hypothetical protein TNCV_1159171 [Trichonephila clavipes]
MRLKVRQIPLSMYVTVIRQKVTGTPKIRFQILIPHPETYTRLTSGAPKRTSSATRGNANPHAGLEHEAISPNSRYIRQSYGCF